MDSDERKFMMIIIVRTIIMTIMKKLGKSKCLNPIPDNNWFRGLTDTLFTSGEFSC